MLVLPSLTLRVWMVYSSTGGWVAPPELHQHLPERRLQLLPFPPPFIVTLMGGLTSHHLSSLVLSHLVLGTHQYHSPFYLYNPIVSFIISFFGVLHLCLPLNSIWRMQDLGQLQLSVHSAYVWPWWSFSWLGHQVIWLKYLNLEWHKSVAALETPSLKVC